MSSKKGFLLVAIVLAIALALTGCIRIAMPELPVNTPGETTIPATGNDLPSPPPSEEPTADDMAIRFSGTDISGNTLTEAYLKEHKINFINYWATWCGPCVGEMPELALLHAKYGAQVGFLSICDDFKDAKATAIEILSKEGVTFPCLPPDTGLEKAFGQISAIPVTMILDDKGNALHDPIVGAIGIDAYSRILEDLIVKLGI